MTKIKQKLPLLLVGAGFLAGLLVGVGMMVGTLYTVSQTDVVEAPAAQPAANVPADFPYSELKAATAGNGKTLAMATGQIDDESEGLFVLDFLTGDLYCWVFHPRRLVPGSLLEFTSTTFWRTCRWQRGKTRTTC